MSLVIHDLPSTLSYDDNVFFLTNFVILNKGLSVFNGDFISNKILYIKKTVFLNEGVSTEKMLFNNLGSLKLKNYNIN